VSDRGSRADCPLAPTAHEVPALARPGACSAPASRGPGTTDDDLGGDVQVEACSLSAAIAAVVDSLPIPRPFTLERFVRTLGRQRGRPIQLVAAPLGATAPCGLLVVTADVDLVCYASNTNWRHQIHIVLHEIGHLLLGHSNHHLPSEDADATVDTAGIVDGQGAQGPSGLDAWVPGFSASLIRRLLARSRYDDSDERDAEVFATLAGGRVGRALGRTGWTGPRGTDVLELRAVFDVPAPRKPGWLAGG
jgi:hypothetical protein